MTRILRTKNHQPSETMDTISEIARAFQSTMSTFSSTSPMVRLQRGDFGIHHYKSILREVFHYTKEDPQMQSLVTVYFRGADRDTVKMFLKHATSEIGHEYLALNDLQSLGVDVSSVAESNPLPATMALTAFPFYQIVFRNPIGYLGYLYFLEFMPTQMGHIYAAALQRAGVPETALGFLTEHMSVDQAHNNLMFEYLKRLVHDRDDLDCIIYAMRVTGHLYSEMLCSAMNQAEMPLDFGFDPHERRRITRPLQPAGQKSGAVV